MKSFLKTVFRSFKNNLGRFISIVSITLIAITAYSGIGTISQNLKGSVDKYYHDYNLSDVIIKNTTGMMDEETIKKIANLSYVEEYTAYTQIDQKVGDLNCRFYIFDDFSSNINKLKLIEGEFPKDLKNEILVEQANRYSIEYHAGDTVSLNVEGMNLSAKVSGIVQNPLTLTKEGEPDLVDLELLDLIVYATYDIVPEFLMDLIPTTDIALTFVKNSNYEFFTSRYEDFIDIRIERLKEELLNDDLAYLTYNENKTYQLIFTYSKKIDLLAVVIPILFMVVSILVISTTISRFIEEDRASIACFSSLGASNSKIRFKFLFFTFISSLIGSIFGMIIGLTLLPIIIYPGFETLIFIPEFVNSIEFWPGFFASSILIFIGCVFALIIVNKTLKANPATLLLPKSPKAGKKIFLEKIKFIWNKLPFRYKSSFRNIIRNKRHLIMTIVSVSGSSALIMVGLSLLDVVSFDESLASSGLKDTLIPIVTLIIILSLLMSIFVIYNLTNMNISERVREIATLGVLGYKEHEICMYIFREITIMAVIGAIFGLPLGALLTYFLLGFLEFGNIGMVQWYTYLAGVGLVILFIVIVDLLLIKKILKIDMMTSLKSVD